MSTLKLLAKRWLMLAAELKELDAMLDRLTSQSAKRLREQFGVGPQTAAILMAVAGDNPERLRNEAALAALCGVSPLQASSGKTTRHRLNRGGDRSANNALWTIAMVRMRSEPRTRAYVERRTMEGMSGKEIHRCLKRYIAKQVSKSLLIKRTSTKGARTACSTAAVIFGQQAAQTQETIDYAYSLISLLLGAKRFFALSVRRVHQIASRSYVDRTLVAAWHLWSSPGSL
jgi:hypothetical protein